jgi:predicted NBD/HSP70 family sugar kinase
VVVEPSGTRCACGARGCLETVVGSRRRASASRRADALAAALHNVVHLLDPQAVVLGGGLAGDDGDLAEAVGQRLNATTLGGRWRPCPVRGSTVGPDAALVGAATVALDGVVADPTTVPLDPLSATA